MALTEAQKLELIREALQWYAAHLEGEARRLRAMGQRRHAETVDARVHKCLVITGDADDEG